MKAIGYLICFIFSSFLLASCSEDHDCEEGVIESPNAVATIDPTSYQDALADCRLPKVQNFSINGGEGGQVFGMFGTVITIPPQNLTDSNGVLIDGPVDIQLLEFYNNGDIVACQLSTNTLNTTGSIEPTFTKGLIYSAITFNGNPVTVLESIQIFIPDEGNGEELVQFMSPSCPDIQCRVLWERNLNTEVIGGTIDNPDGTLTTGYSTFIQELGWLSIGQFNQSTDRTTVYNKAPDGYEMSNSDVFLVYDSSEIGIGLLSQYNESLGVFDENFGEIPIGQVASFVLTGRQDQYQFSTDSVTISQNIIGVTTDISTGTEEELATAINAL